ncbi:hypothetical protein NC652_020397 [Populus alba x Populus x berolinensis]|uniref:Uncharacterized protein n=2 Tax=Populus TaxID=3689 RepID=A0A4U5R5Q6_POPAL|nr:hypothetical protein NC652_020397 [Populus alba x Populus x berolinensis]KAJ6986917.1 hypothetical protein NC653_020223 [Populus alba x Populus x berolinensis]TKS17777.1 hypothetical protein D5086_0000011480 [Populus alba]
MSLSLLSFSLNSHFVPYRLQETKERKSFFSSHLSFHRFSLLFSLQPNNNGKVIRIQKLHGITTLYYPHRSKTLISTNCQSIPLLASQGERIGGACEIGGLD